MLLLPILPLVNYQLYSMKKVYLHLASKTRLGAVTLLAVQFQDFLQEDGRYLLFLLSMTDQNLLSTIQSNQVGQLAWYVFSNGGVISNIVAIEYDSSLLNWNILTCQ